MPVASPERIATSGFALPAMTPFDAVRNLRAAGGVGPYGLMPDAYCLMPVASPQ